MFTGHTTRSSFIHLFIKYWWPHLPQEGPAGGHELVVDEPLRQQPVIVTAQLAAARVNLQQQQQQCRASTGWVQKRSRRGRLQFQQNFLLVI
jgi:hypothetical protein